jgi:hypothetical protein
MCQYHDEIVDMKVHMVRTDASGSNSVDIICEQSLQRVSKFSPFMSNGFGMIQYSRANSTEKVKILQKYSNEEYINDLISCITFSNGAMMCGAFNGPFLLQSTHSLLKTLHLQVDVIDIIVLDTGNGYNWARKVFNDCSWFEKRARSRELTGSFQHILLSFEHLGFHGKFVFPLDAANKLSATYSRRLALNNRSLVFRSAAEPPTGSLYTYTPALNASLFHCQCTINQCNIGCDHQCMPGPPDDQAHMILHLLQF